MSIGRRLALYSDMETTTNSVLDERVLRLIGHVKPRIGYIAATPDPDRIYFERARRSYWAMGLELSVYIDLNASERQLAAVFACDAIHLSGGNTFTFLSWLRQRGLLAGLRRYAISGGVLIGVSAGAILMTPSVASAALCADVRAVGMTDDTALGLVDFNFWPHAEPGQPPEPGLTQLASQLANLYQCPDGAGIVVDGGQIEVFGAQLVRAR